MVDAFGSAVLIALFGIVGGYVWITHVVDARVEAAASEHANRLERIEERLDTLEAAVEESDS